MIAHLRRRHRYTWLLLAILLPLVIITAWRARRPAPMMDRLPEALTSGDPKP